MSAIAAPADRRFRRAHVKPARKSRGWRSRMRPLLQYAVGALIVALLMYRAAIVVARAHVLQVDRITVTGNERLSRGEVLAVLSGLRGESLLFTDLNHWRTRLLASPWVRDAALRRSLPSTVDVMVWERRPVAIGRVNDDMYLIDESGVVIDQYGPQYADLDLPLVDGLAGAGGDSGSITDEGKVDLATRVIAAVKAKPEIAKRLSQIDVNDPRNVSVILSGDTAILELGDDQFLARLESYLQLAPPLR
jgi:cell division septal protein FtsQ